MDPAIEAKAYELLAKLYRDKSPPPNRPFVTVTYAQTQDGFIGVREGPPLIISGPESMILTHALRACNEGILVGINTVLSDNPMLTTRQVLHGPPFLSGLWNSSSPNGQPNSPRPIILDSKLRIPLNARLLTRNPLIFTGQVVDISKADKLEAAGGKVISVSTNEDGSVALAEVLIKLVNTFGIKSLMVEGGASVIESFVRTVAGSHPNCLVDAQVVTTGPNSIGAGVKLLSSQPWSSFNHMFTETSRFGSDTVFVATRAQ
ncbi:dihydrofolate reductase-like domain-containing protein [Cladochytrium replicatum]|nr:dihydrofolate reductase-like domain-containing protein [Cladochytrium replicatum]